MATVHLGRLLGPVGFSRTVAIKRLHPQFARDPEFVSMFLDEARVAARVRHPNVVSTLDVVTLEGELFLVMEYVQGETLSRLLRLLRDKSARVPLSIVCAIMVQVLTGLHAAHEAKNERGAPLHLVHRDMSPQNVIVGDDGVARVLDFGVAKATGRVQMTREGQLKGKLAYVAPEQLKSGTVDRRTDIYSASVTLWEVLTTQRLFQADSEFQLVHQVLDTEIPRPSTLAPNLPRELDDIVMRGVARDPEARFATAREMALALERSMPLATQREVGEWVEEIAGDALHERASRVAEIETDSAISMSPFTDDLNLADSNVAARGVAEEDTVGFRRRTIPPPPVAVENISTGTLVSASEDEVKTVESGISSLISQRSIQPPPEKRQSIPTILIIALASLGSALAVALVFTLRDAGTTLRETHAASANPPILLRGEAPAPPMEPVEIDDVAIPEANEISTVPPASAVKAPPHSPPPVVHAPVQTGASGNGTQGAGPKKPPREGNSSAQEAPKADCNPPYTVDAHGIRHLKPECL